MGQLYLCSNIDSWVSKIKLRRLFDMGAEHISFISHCKALKWHAEHKAPGQYKLPTTIARKLSRSVII